MMDVRGWYGFNKNVKRGATFGANAKAGMDNKESEKYFFNAIVPLYLNVADVEGKRVAIIADSGPGRLNDIMLAKLRILGFHLIAGEPNTTHGTQATDHNYRLFKSTYRVNLQKLTDYRVERKGRECKEAGQLVSLLWIHRKYRNHRLQWY